MAKAKVLRKKAFEDVIVRRGQEWVILRSREGAFKKWIRPMKRRPKKA